MRIDNYLRWNDLDGVFLDVGNKIFTLALTNERQAARIAASGLKALATLSVALLGSSLLNLAGLPLVGAAVFMAGIGLGARTAYLEYNEGQFRSFEAVLAATASNIVASINHFVARFRF